MEFINGEKYELNKGDFMPFDARVEHNVIAKVKSKVLGVWSSKVQANVKGLFLI